MFISNWVTGLDGRFFGAAGRAVKRQVLHQRLIGDDHARSVGAGVARHTFHVAGSVDQVAQVICFLINLFEFR